MKKVLFVLCCLMLVACSTSKNMEQKIEETLNKVENTVAPNYVNNQKLLFDYYLSPSIGKISSTQTSSVLQMLESTIIMNLDVSAVIENVYYEFDGSKFAKQGNEVFYKKGTFKDSDNRNNNYAIFIYQSSDDYFLRLVTDYMYFGSTTSFSEIDDILFEMFNIAKSLNIHYDNVVTMFSNKEIQEHIREKNEIYDSYIPESGRIEEIFNNPSNSEGDIHWSVDDFDISDTYDKVE